MWQICGYVPQTLDNPQEMIEMAAQLSTTFFIETFIHAKEKVREYAILFSSLQLNHHHSNKTL